MDINFDLIEYLMNDENDSNSWKEADFLHKVEFIILWMHTNNKVFFIESDLKIIRMKYYEEYKNGIYLCNYDWDKVLTGMKIFGIGKFIFDDEMIKFEMNFNEYRKLVRKKNIGSKIKQVSRSKFSSVELS